MKEFQWPYSGIDKAEFLARIVFVEEIRQKYGAEYIEDFRETNTWILKELSAKCGITHQSAMQLMKRLQSKGYVSIVPDDRDKRAIRIAATDKCDKWKDQYAADNMQYIDMLFSDLDKNEIETLGMAQFKIYERLEKMAEELKL